MHGANDNSTCTTTSRTLEKKSENRLMDDLFFSSTSFSLGAMLACLTRLIQSQVRFSIGSVGTEKTIRNGKGH